MRRISKTALVCLQAVPFARYLHFSPSHFHACKLQNLVSYFWHYFMSYFLICSAWKAATYDREQVTTPNYLIDRMARLKFYLRTYRARGSTCPYQPSKRRVHRSVATTGLGWSVPASKNDSTRTRRQTHRQLELCGPCRCRSYQLPNAALPRGLPSHPRPAQYRSSLCLAAHSAHRRPSALAQAVRRYRAVALSVVLARQPQALNQLVRAQIAGVKRHEDIETFLW